MIERIQWHQPHNRDELRSPFLRGASQRPLRLTFHSESLSNLGVRERDALSLLRELANLSHIEAIDTAAGDLPQMVLGDVDVSSDLLPLRIDHPDRSQHMSVGLVSECRRLAERLASELAVSPTVDETFGSILIARAHREAEGDILVTACPLLLERRDVDWIGTANPRMPDDALKIVGLYLRTRDIYMYQAAQDFTLGLNRGLFYLGLARQRLAGVWHYLSGCFEAESIRQDGIRHLGQGVLFRCCRALEARDAIGECFYATVNNDARDRMMYHFDYLTLLVVGALDAQARIANRAYGAVPDERNAGFQRETFAKQLKQVGATKLHSLARSRSFRDVLLLAYKPRNTIHGAPLATRGYLQTVQPEGSFVRLPDDDADDIWDAAERLGSASSWGLLRHGSGTWLEPYSYAVRLVEESLQAVNSVAAATDVTRLFPPGYSVPPLPSAPPSRPPFDSSTVARIDLIG